MNNTSKSRILWGAATSSFQIEGAATEDGKGPSIWDTFCRIPGKISDGSNGDVACNHYHQMESDVELMAELGLDAYRFSIAWPRVFPQGVGSCNVRGLDFYDRLVDALLRKGIVPYPTLYHWDLPQALEDRGGWTNPEMPQWFADYTDAVVKRLGDRVMDWTTLNEPHVFCLLGYGLPFHAPGRSSLRDCFLATRNALLSHGLAAQRIRALLPKARVGIANCYPLPEPAAAGQEVAADKLDQIMNRIFFDPIIHGTIPPYACEVMAAQGVCFSNADMDVIHQPLDFVGINYYMRVLAKHSDDLAHPFAMEHPNYVGMQRTDVDWEVYPHGLEEVLRRMRDDYGNLPVYITENGAAFNDIPSQDGQIHDARRVDYYEQHIQALRKAIHDGCNVHGYFAWSLMDNFEWGHGYSQRFGLVFVDFAQGQKRIFKDSARWYQRLIREEKAAAT